MQRLAGLDKSQLLSFYRQMLLIRRCEEQLARSHQRGLIHGACHTYVGQEAIAVGVCANLKKDDVIFSTHRGHGHALAKGVSSRQLFAELFGRETGCSHGRGGSMHLFAPEIGLMGTSKPDNIFVREAPGMLVVLLYFALVPPILGRFFFRDYIKQAGLMRFLTTAVLLLFMASLPIKMVLRWTMNLKYLVAIPEYFFNI